MKYLVLTLFLPLFLTSASFASEIRVAGTVTRNIGISWGKNVSFSANYDHYLEIESVSGQTSTYFFQYNESIELKNENLKKVKIYAP